MYFKIGFRARPNITRFGDKSKKLKVDFTLKKNELIRLHNRRIGSTHYERWLYLHKNPIRVTQGSGHPAADQPEKIVWAESIHIPFKIIILVILHRQPYFKFWNGWPHHVVSESESERERDG